MRVLSTIVWQKKFKAAVIHASLTALIALLTGYIIFYLWYPGPLAKMLGGIELYWLVVAVEISLGPIISLVIFNPKKKRSELLKDYTLVVSIQLAALFYGLYTVAQSRPVFFVFVKDSFEVVTAIELENRDLALASPPYNKKSWFGPLSVCSESPVDPKRKSHLLFSALSGKDIQFYPEYYRQCYDGEIASKTYRHELLLEILKRKNDHSKYMKKLPASDFTWLPIKYRFGAWISVYPNNNITQYTYLPINPFDS